MPTEAHATGLVSQLLSVFLYLGSEWVMYLLILLSVVSIGVALERSFYFMRTRSNLPVLEQELQNLLRKGDVDAALKMMESQSSMPAKVASVGLSSISLGKHAAEELMSAAIMRERAVLERGLAYLGTLGNNAPFVGLFGTVLGIIRSFRDLSSNTQQGASAVMGGIAEALVATAVGLLVALPAVALFNAFNRHVRTMVNTSVGFNHIVLAFAKDEVADGRRK